MVRKMMPTGLLRRSGSKLTPGLYDGAVRTGLQGYVAADQRADASDAQQDDCSRRSSGAPLDDTQQSGYVLKDKIARPLGFKDSGRRGQIHSRHTLTFAQHTALGLGKLKEQIASFIGCAKPFSCDREWLTRKSSNAEIKICKSCCVNFSDILSPPVSKSAR